ncbi:hypothetical protein [Tuanshanicoccus lijuaniae]|uniref:hypothetical protein n=1 Tax=Aerococcaceae bacterium zg-1292 TaxID=2774330 RepID=UPI001BD8A354|nr:hypothetical protein [Aerococcaceae bacterium zg-BR9]MBF6626273.1 hypothetical protein [Aerococcaceae bacterium zg-BR9]MBS4456256.1 hypothetical protein [Aerococcaceae bacterium zg-A91]MBS4458157.1 hypothetical protein [Aerococcaceae bacterium zg-BR33]
MKKILLLIALFFIAGCSENKNKENNISESPSANSKTLKQEENAQKINDVFSITNSALKEFTDKKFNLYNIIEVSRDEDSYNDLFSSIYEEPISFEKTMDGYDTVYHSRSETRSIRIQQHGRNLSIFNSLLPTSKLWAVHEIMKINQQGEINLPQISEDNPTIVQGKQLIEKFLKENFNIQAVDVSYVYCDGPTIDEFKEMYKKWPSAKEEKEIHLSSAEPFVYYKVTSKIEGVKVFGGAIVSEEGGENSISGTTIEFIVRDSKIEEFILHNLYSFDTIPGRQVDITKEELFNKLKAILENRYSEKQFTIDKVSVEYLPIIDNRNKIYEYKPTLVLSTTDDSNDERYHFSPVYIDIETGEEVTR